MNIQATTKQMQLIQDYSELKIDTNIKLTSTPDKHLHILMLQTVVHHPRQVFQDLQGMRLGLSSKVPRSYLFVVH